MLRMLVSDVTITMPTNSSTGSMPASDRPPMRMRLAKATV